MTSKGVEKIQHDFKGTDGSQPSADMMVSNNVLYGTTYVGGKFGFGTVFSLSRTGTLKTLHSFEDTTADGGFLQGGLVKVGIAVLRHDRRRRCERRRNAVQH